MNKKEMKELNDYPINRLQNMGNMQAIYTISIIKAYFLEVSFMLLFI